MQSDNHGEKNGANPTSVMRFQLKKEIPLSDDCVEFAFDDTKQLQAYALLNNHIMLLDNNYETVGKLVHEGNNKINRIKLSDGLICVSGTEKAIIFYDPKANKAIKRIESKNVMTCSQDRTT